MPKPAARGRPRSARKTGSPAAAGDVREAVGDALTVTDGRPLGAARPLFVLVANRCVDPRSQLAAAEWASCTRRSPGCSRWMRTKACRAMDLLIEADAQAQAQVQAAVFSAVADRLDLEVDLLCFDATSTDFDCDAEVAPDEQQQAGGLRRYGHFTDRRPHLPQIVN